MVVLLDSMRGSLAVGGSVPEWSDVVSFWSCLARARRWSKLLVPDWSETVVWGAVCVCVCVLQAVFFELHAVNRWVDGGCVHVCLLVLLWVCACVCVLLVLLWVCACVCVVSIGMCECM